MNGRSRIDSIYRSLIYAAKFFSKGWGDIKVMEQIFEMQEIVRKSKGLNGRLLEICEKTEVNVKKTNINNSLQILEGQFKSPFMQVVPNGLPPECRIARFQMILPMKWKFEKPVCIHLAGTGDHFFWRRRQFMAIPLAKEYSIGSIILENPYYGYRKPKDQNKSGLRHVSDLFVMGGALTFETITLILWCERQGFGPLGVTGISMGGHMASVASAACTKPIAIIPCLSWSTAAPVFTEGVMKSSVSWDVLEKQLNTQPEYIKLLENYSSEYSNRTMRTEEESQDDTKVINKNQLPESRGSSPNRNGTDSDNAKRYANFELNGKLSRLFTIDREILEKLESIPTHWLNSVTDKLNFDILKDYSFIYNDNLKSVSQETIEYMNCLMNLTTHLRNLSKPNSSSKIIYVVASHDMYVPRDNVISPAEIWNVNDIRYMDCGHIVGAVKYQKVFRDAISDALQWVQ